MSVDLSDDEIAQRLAGRSAVIRLRRRPGWAGWHVEDVGQAYDGADVGVLAGGSGHEQPHRAN